MDPRVEAIMYHWHDGFDNLESLETYVQRLETRMLWHISDDHDICNQNTWFIKLKHVLF